MNVGEGARVLSARQTALQSIVPARGRLADIHHMFQKRDRAKGRVVMLRLMRVAPMQCLQRAAVVGFDPQ